MRLKASLGGLLFFSALLGSAASCNLLTPLVFVGEHKKKISAEFDKIGNDKVAVVVWTDPATLFDYPHARFELATYVGDKLSTELAQRNRHTTVVDSRDVEDFLQKNIDAQINPEVVGKRFHADFVIYLEILGFQIRDPDRPQFLRATIHSSVAVYDRRADRDGPARYELTPVKCEYPAGAPVIFQATNAPLIRESVYRVFAEQVARKFYDYTVAL